MGKRKRVEQSVPEVDEDSGDEQIQAPENGKWTLADRRLIVLLEGAQLETVKVCHSIFSSHKFIILRICVIIFVANILEW